MTAEIARDRDLYRIHDREDTPAIAVKTDEAAAWNAKGWGIFWTVNAFAGRPRRIANLDRVLAWTVELDDGSKVGQVAQLARSPLRPSLVIESKRGYHVYFNAAPGADPEGWDGIVRDRLIPFFGGDPRAADRARVLRVPGFLHQKDPADPFEIRIVYRLDVAYSDLDMARAFPDANRSERARKAEARRRAAAKRAEVRGGDFWERAMSLDCRQALLRLSGHPAVNGEEFSLDEQRNGNANILVNGKGTSCFVDENGDIGSMDGGGPGVAQWLTWYGRDYREVRRILLEVFPELEERQ